MTAESLLKRRLVAVEANPRDPVILSAAATACLKEARYLLETAARNSNGRIPKAEVDTILLAAERVGEIASELGRARWRGKA